MTKSSNDKKTILIIGAGTGVQVARSLAPKLDPASHEIILVEPLPYKSLLPATLRLVVTSEGNLESSEKAFIPLDKVFVPGQPGRVLEDQVVSLTKADGDNAGEAVLKSGERISYDILVIATGSKWTGPIAFPWLEGDAAVQTFIKKQRDQIAAARNIVIAGGGAVGIELAGEIKDFYPDTKVTIVHSSHGLLSDVYPEKFKQSLVRKLDSNRVKVIYNDYIDDFPEGPIEKITTRKGKVLRADLVLSARGPRGNTDIVEGSPYASALTGHNTIKIRPTMQLQGFDNVFAVGDVIEWPETKQASRAFAQAGVVSNNIMSLLTHKSSMKHYKGSNDSLLITFGRSGGIAHLEFLGGWISFVLGDWFVRMIKSKDLLVKMSRPHMGQK